MTQERIEKARDKFMLKMRELRFRQQKILRDFSTKLDQKQIEKIRKAINK
ncbi:MAG: hypothetical protein ABII13_05445 [Patescibacteria group bacterium]|nr:hypothetical protein [Patescibacteria group bacterium]MBU2508889.1 hypothetical protein [Patescibacteria group bacterium]